MATSRKKKKKTQQGIPALTQLTGKNPLNPEFLPICVCPGHVQSCVYVRVCMHRHCHALSTLHLYTHTHTASLGTAWQTVPVPNSRHSAHASTSKHIQSPVCARKAVQVPPTHDVEPLSPPGLSELQTHFPSSSKSWYSSVKRVQVMVAILALGGQARLGAVGLDWSAAAPRTRPRAARAAKCELRTGLDWTNPGLLSRALWLLTAPASLFASASRSPWQPLRNACSRCPVTASQHPACLPLQNLQSDALAPPHTVTAGLCGPRGGWTQHPQGDGLRRGWQKEDNKLSPQVIFSLPTTPTSNCGALVTDRMGLSGAKRQLPW